MAIVQISRIQHRRGLAENLPQLSHAELGWVTDTRSLYIGNGPLGAGAPVVGNTEILTEHSDLAGLINFTYEGNGGATVDTGVTAGTPIVRSLQDRLDDYVSVMDFGASGNGTVDDTAAIQRALYQLFIRDITQKARRSLYFPAGVYKVSAPIEVPTWATLYGDGAGKTIIQYQETQTNATATANIVAGEVASLTVVSGGAGYATAPVVTITGDGTLASFQAVITDGVITSFTQISGGSGYSFANVAITSSKTAGHDSCVMRTVDSLGQAAPNIGNNSATQPQSILVKGMTIKSTDTTNVLQDCIQIDSTLNSFFDDVAFVGTYTSTSGLSGSDRPAGFKISQTPALKTRNVVFHGCSFQGVPIGVYSNDDIEGLSFQNCNFDTMFKGFWLGETTSSGEGPHSINISGSLFRDIDYEAIDVDYGIGIRSVGNTFLDVGNNGDADGSGSATTDANVIDFSATNVSDCSSISDRFGRADGDLGTHFRVATNNSDSYALIVKEKEVFGRREHTIAQTLTLADNQTSVTTGLTFAEASYKYVKITYKIERGTESRTGVMNIAIKSGASNVADAYNETAVLGVSFAMSHAAGVGTLQYTTTSTGSAATMTYYIEYLN